ncbi:MAG TPA: N-6 DNA methylase [Gemmataceae bacterium]|nr:N-6 DNA methylase [Gemmataceae bacterium]
MNFIAYESSEKLRGGYYTRADVADFLTRWVLQARPRRILEPACGDGAFVASLGRLDAAGVESVIGCEIFAAEAEKARMRGRVLRGMTVEVLAEDFLQWALDRLPDGPTFDAAIGNPPFIRYQYLNSQLQERAEQLFRRFGLAFTKHTNAWVPFVVASLALLRPGGRLAMVVPSELLHILHARSLRSFLSQECARILVLDPQDIWFEETLQGVVLLLAEKRVGPGSGAAQLALMPVKDRTVLAAAPEEFFHRADFFPASLLNGKWMLGLLSREERTLLERLAAHPAIRPFRDLASVDVGIVTGANKFFLVPQDVVRQYGLGPWTHPMFGRSEHVGGVIYDKRCHRRNQEQGLPAHFLWLGDRPLNTLPASVRRYIREGEEQGLHRRYKCRIRTPWYNVPSVYAAPAALLKRCHHFPRLILNTAQALTTDTAYRIRPHKGRSVDLVIGFVNSLTALSAELEGRHYGGGVLELVPSEIERLPVPALRHSKAALHRLDAALRSKIAAEDLLAQQDRLVLGPLGIREPEIEVLRGAWRRLRGRRQRT